MNSCILTFSSGDNFTASGTLGGSGVHLCYHQKASETLQFGVELETSLRLQESTASMAYQVEIPKANFTFRGKITNSIHYEFNSCLIYF